MLKPNITANKNHIFHKKAALNLANNKAITVAMTMKMDNGINEV